MKKLSLVALLITLSITFVGCGLDAAPTTHPQTSASGAQTADVAKQFRIPVNAESNTSEQQNIIDRQKATSDPTKIMWMHLVDLNGRIYLRTPVRGKITSSSKRLEPVSCAAGMANGQGADVFYGAKTPDNHRTPEMVQIDGTYGSSDPYVFWFDPRGYYYQFGQGYILSDMPINLKAPVDELTGLYNLDKAAQDWQKSQSKAK